MKARREIVFNSERPVATTSQRPPSVREEVL